MIFQNPVLTDSNLDENDVLNELGFNDNDFDAGDDDLDEADEEGLDENDEDYQDPNDDGQPKTETATDEENKKRAAIKKRAPKTCEKCHKTYNTQTQFRIHQRVSFFSLSLYLTL